MSATSTVLPYFANTVAVVVHSQPHCRGNIFATQSLGYQTSRKTQIPDPGSPRRPLHGRSRGRPPHRVVWAAWTTNSLILIISPATLFFAWLGWDSEMVLQAHVMKTLVTTHGTITVPAIAAVTLFTISILITPAIHQLVRGEEHKFSCLLYTSPSPRD